MRVGLQVARAPRRGASRASSSTRTWSGDQPVRRPTQPESSSADRKAWRHERVEADRRRPRTGKRAGIPGSGGDSGEGVGDFDLEGHAFDLRELGVDAREARRFYSAHAAIACRPDGPRAGASAGRSPPGEERDSGGLRQEALEHHLVGVSFGPLPVLRAAHRPGHDRAAGRGAGRGMARRREGLARARRGTAAATSSKCRRFASACFRSAIRAS